LTSKKKNDNGFIHILLEKYVSWGKRLMKKLVLAVLLAMSLVLVGCGDDDDNGGGGGSAGDCPADFGPILGGTAGDVQDVSLTTQDIIDMGSLSYLGIPANPQSAYMHVEQYSGVTAADVAAFEAELIADGYEYKLNGLNNVFHKTVGTDLHVINFFDKDPGDYQVERYLIKY
jgi:hypothetical protein